MFSTYEKYPTKTSELDSIFARADASDPTRDVRKLLRILQTMMVRNPRINGHYNVRTTAVSAFGFEIRADDDSANDLALSAQARCRTALNTLLRYHARVPFFGALCAEVAWQFSEESGQIPKLNILPTHRVEQLQNGVNILADGNDLKRTATVNIGDVDMRYIAQVDTMSPFCGGLLRAILPTEILRSITVNEIAGFVQLQKGLLQMIVREGATDQEISATEERVKTARKAGFVMSSDMIELKLNDVVSGSAEAFTQLIDLLNRDIAIACLGQANTSELPNSGGSRAALQVMKSVSADIHYADIQRAEEICNTLLLLDYRMNIDQSAEIAPYQFRVAIEEEQDYEKNAIVVREALATQLPLSRNEVYARLGFSVPAEGAEVVQMGG